MSSAVTHIGVSCRGRRLARPAVQVRAERAGLERREPLREQRADHAGEHVAGARGRQRRACPHVLIDLPPVAADDRAARPSARQRVGPPRALPTRIPYRPAPRRASTPSSRASSPGCGVSTVGRRARAMQLDVRRRAR